MELWPLALDSRSTAATHDVAEKPVPRDWLRRFLSRFRRSYQPRAKGELSELNRYLLRDIGVSMQDVEAANWLWRGGWGEISSIRDRHRRC